MFATITSWVGQTTRAFTSSSYSAVAHERRRFNLLLVVTLLQLLIFLGTNWDTQWHVSIGRDSAWIPPHLVAAVAFVAGLGLALGAVTYETWLDRNDIRVPSVRRFGGISAEPTFLALALSHLAIAFFAVVDDQWHRYFGLDATLWSPPHFMMFLGLRAINISLMLGLAASARRLNLKSDWHGAYWWLFVLLSALNIEATTAWTGEAFVFSYLHGGVGLLGMLFQILAGAAYPFSIILSVRLAKSYWIVLPIFAVTLALCGIGLGFTALGFAVLKPVSLLEQYVRDNPYSTVATTRELMRLNSYPPLLVVYEIIILLLSAIPLLLVALLSRVPGARGRWLLAAPVYSISLNLCCYIGLQRMTALISPDITWAQMAAAILLSTIGGLALGWLGLKLAEVLSQAEIPLAGAARIEARP